MIPNTCTRPFTGHGNVCVGSYPDVEANVSPAAIEANERSELAKANRTGGGAPRHDIDDLDERHNRTE